MHFTKIKQPDKNTLERLTLSKGQFSTRADVSFDQPLFSYVKRKIIRRFTSSPHCTLYFAEKNMHFGFAILDFLEWDSKIFGFKIGRIENHLIKINHSSKLSFFNNIIQDCIEQQYDHINCRVGLKDFETLHVLERLGFNVMDVQITLTTEVGFQSNSFSCPDKLVIREATANDLDELKEIVRGAFTDTRFVIDTRYPKEGVDRLYFEWIKNSVLGSEESVFVAQDRYNGRLIGFLICKYDPDSEETLGLRIGSIDLIAITKNYRNQGIGQTVIKFALNKFKTKVDRVEIRTQVSNIPAIKAFMKGGFKEFSPGIMLPAGIYMHRWF